MKPPPPFQVAPWQVEPDRNLMTSGEREVRLGARTMAVLAHLAHSGGRVVTREELLDTVWEGRAISDGALTVAISELRKVLGDHAEAPRYIETIKGRGYRWTAEVRELVPRSSSSKSMAPAEAGAAVHGGAARGSARKGFRWSLFFGSAVAATAILAGEGLELLRQVVETRDPPESVASGSGRLNPRIEPEAKRLLESGLESAERMSPAAYAEASDSFRRAAELAPSFAFAHILLADANLNLSLLRPSERANLSLEAYREAQEALALDPTLPRAYLVAGIVAMFVSWDLEEAESYFRKAIQLDPGMAAAHERYGVLLAVKGRLGAAEVRMRAAEELEPSDRYHQALGEFLSFAGKPREALEVLEPTLGWQPPWLHHGWYHRALALERLDRQEEAFNCYLKFIEAAIPDSDLQSLRAAFAAGGIARFHRLWLETLGERMNLLLRARLLTRLGEHDRALELVARMVEERSPELLLVAADASFAPLRRRAEMIQALGAIRPFEPSDPPAVPASTHVAWLLR
jgi:DNA-binding winged helix-turn-helix (wHTH) protein/tetratricopeptide (TPR) repeat protein